MCRLYANTMPFHIRDLSSHGFRCPWRVLEPIPLWYPGALLGQSAYWSANPQLFYYFFRWIPCVVCCPKHTMLTATQFFMLCPRVFPFLSVYPFLHLFTWVVSSVSAGLWQVGRSVGPRRASPAGSSWLWLSSVRAKPGRYSPDFMWNLLIFT